jgi:hypothetical protein
MQERTSDVVHLTLGSEIYPTNAADCVVFVEVSTGAAKVAPMRRHINRSNIESEMGERRMNRW